MSSLLNMLAGQLSGPAIKEISSQLGADEGTTQTAINAALPMLLGALSKNASDPSGAEALTNALSRDHDGSILDNLSSALGDSATSQMGAGILKHVLGGSQGVAEQSLSKVSGLDAGSTGQLLQMLAPIMMGALGKTQRDGGLDAAGIAGMLMNERQSAESSLGGMASLLDFDGDGSIADDVMSLGGKLLGGLFGSK